MGIVKTLLKRNTALLLSGQLVSTMGSIMQATVLPLYVFTLTGSAVTFASVLAVAIIPRLFGPFTGIVTDRQSRKQMLILLDVIAGILTLLFAVWHQFFGGLLLPCVYVLVLLLAVVQTFYDPTVSAIIPEIVSKNALEETNSASSLISSVAYIAAPILAGLLYARSSLFAVMVINGISFFAAAVLELFISYKSAAELHKVAQEPVFKSLKEGLSTVFQNRELTLIVIISVAANLALNPIFSVGMPFIMKKVLLVSDTMYGLSQSMLFIGPVIGSVLAGFILKRTDYKRMLTWILLLDSGLIAVLAIFTAMGSISLGTLALFFCINTAALLIVATIVLASIAMATALQKIVPIHLLGRVSGVDTSVSLLAIPLGQMLFGWIISILNPQITLLIFACLALVTGLLAFVLYRPMLRAQVSSKQSGENI